MSESPLEPEWTEQEFPSQGPPLVLGGFAFNLPEGFVEVTLVTDSVGGSLTFGSPGPDPARHVLWDTYGAGVRLCVMMDDFIITLPPLAEDGEQETYKVQATVAAIDDYEKRLLKLTERHERLCLAAQRVYANAIGRSRLAGAKEFARTGDYGQEALLFEPQRPEFDPQGQVQDAYEAVVIELRAFIQRHGVADD